MRRFISLIASAAVMSVPAIAAAHDTPNLEHSHAFQKTGYGTYRQGHSVNGPQGSIIIWSPRPYTGYQNGPAVKFARPQPITRAPGTPAAPAPGRSQPARVHDQMKPNDRGQ
jgi:hypothetical protein